MNYEQKFTEIMYAPDPPEAGGMGIKEALDKEGLKHCRMDIKVYPWSMLPYAVNYFSGSQSFCRALRFWCNTPNAHVAQLASSYYKTANSFKLSDTSLLPMELVYQGQHKEQSQSDGRPVPCQWESDIFKAVGLQYVPPHLRNI
eukprot:gene27061-2292_t